MMESKLLVGGKSIVDKTTEQERDLERRRQEIADQKVVYLSVCLFERDISICIKLSFVHFTSFYLTVLHFTSLHFSILFTLLRFCWVVLIIYYTTWLNETKTRSKITRPP